MDAVRWFAGLALFASLCPQAHAQQGPAENPEATHAQGGNRSTDWGSIQQAAQNETDAYNALAAAAKAQTAMYEAQHAALQLKYGGIAGVKETGGVNFADDKAGKPEALLLIHRSARGVAAEIFDQVCHSLSGAERTLLIVTDESGLSLDDALLFDLQTSEVEAAFEVARRQFREAREHEPRNATGGAAPAAPSGGNRGLLPIAGALTDSLSKLGSYFQSSYTFGEVSTEDFFDSSAIAYALAGKLRSEPKCPPLPKGEPGGEFRGKVIIPERQLVRSLGSIQNNLTDLGRTYIQVLGEHTASTSREAALTAANNSHAASYYTSAAAAAKRAIELYTALVNKVTETGSKAGNVQVAPFIVRVARQKAAEQHLSSDQNALVLLVHGDAAAQYYAKKNLWTFLGGPPIYTAGAVTASYMLILPPTGEVWASGTAAEHGGYQSIRKVQRLFDGK